MSGYTALISVQTSTVTVTVLIRNWQETPGGSVQVRVSWAGVLRGVLDIDLSASVTFIL